MSTVIRHRAELKSFECQKKGQIYLQFFALFGISDPLDGRGREINKTHREIERETYRPAWERCNEKQTGRQEMDGVVGLTEHIAVEGENNWNQNVRRNWQKMTRKVRSNNVSRWVAVQRREQSRYFRDV